MLFRNSSGLPAFLLTSYACSARVSAYLPSDTGIYIYLSLLIIFMGLWHFAAVQGLPAAGRLHWHTSAGHLDSLKRIAW